MTNSQHTTDLQADYREAQASGHHIDCDGYRTSHRTTITRDNAGLYVATCDECGPLHIGSFGREADAHKRTAGHSSEVRCDGRCQNWEIAA